MKIALAIFHFNPHWNFDARSAHRHCTAALFPFLRTVLLRREWRATISISVSGLEFISQTYPGNMRVIQDLVHEGRLELLSSLFTPSIWCAFGQRDLLWSIKLAKQTLAKMSLPWVRIFFAQEAFFGEGLTELQEYYDAGVCKDDYLAYHYDAPFASRCLRRNGLKVIAASNHILNELRQEMKSTPEFAVRHNLSAIHVRHLERTSTLNDSTSFPAARGRIGGTEWLWYHCGDGNHFGSIYKPDDLLHCSCDPVWSTLCVDQIESYRRRGYTLGTVQDFLNSIDYSDAYELPPLVEGAWNPRQAGGLFCWMGRNDSAAENDAGLLAAISQARRRVVLAEDSVCCLGVDSDTSIGILGKVEEAWRTLLHAQISDSLGWSAGSVAVQQCFRAADHVSLLANQVLDQLGRLPGGEGSDEMVQTGIQAENTSEREWPAMEVFGVEGFGDHIQPQEQVAVYECQFTSNGTRCGVRLPFPMQEIVFCPSGMETKPLRISRSVFQCPVLTLPLANGLIQIDESMFLVKDTAFVHVCATLDLEHNTIEFAIEGGKGSGMLHWRFWFVNSSLNDAVRFANALNYMNPPPLEDQPEGTTCRRSEEPIADAAMVDQCEVSALGARG